MKPKELHTVSPDGMCDSSRAMYSKTDHIGHGLPIYCQKVWRKGLRDGETNMLQGLSKQSREWIVLLAMVGEFDLDKVERTTRTQTQTTIKRKMSVSHECG